MQLTMSPNISIFIGGVYDWRKKLTIPNILKELNPRLKGISTGDVITSMQISKRQFLVALIAALTNVT